MTYETFLQNASDDQVISGLVNLWRNERKQHATFLAYLSSIEERKLFAREGYSSLFRYLVEQLHYSESSALKRIQVSRLARRFPQIYSLIAEGHVSLSAIERLAPHLNQENLERLLNRVIDKSVREVECLLATEFPKGDAKDSVHPLSEEKYLIQFTARQEFMDNLNQAKVLLCRKYPQGHLVDILNDALKLLLDSGESKIKLPEILEEQVLYKEMFFDPEMKNTPRYIPRGIRKEVWERDQGKCQFKSPEGKVCGETKFLEFDHVLPWALGGSSRTAANIRLLCRAHNQWNAKQDFPNYFRLEDKLSRGFNESAARSSCSAC